MAAGGAVGQAGMSPDLSSGAGRMECVLRRVLPSFLVPEADAPQPQFFPRPSHDCRPVPLLPSCVEPRASPAPLLLLSAHGQDRAASHTFALSSRARCPHRLCPGEATGSGHLWLVVTPAVTIEETRGQGTEPRHGTFCVQLPEAVPETGGIRATRSAETGPGPWGTGNHARGTPPQPLGGNNFQPRILTLDRPQSVGRV